MKATSAAALALAAMLLLASVALGVRIAGHWPRAQIELARERTSELDPRLRARLQQLPGRLQLTYYASPRAQMPSHMRRMRDEVERVLAQLAAAAPTQVQYALVDPTADPELERFAARRRVAPVRVRSIERDAYSERTVWSSLTLTYAHHPPAVIQGLEPAHLPRLQALIEAQLDQMEQARAPRVLLSAPERGFDELRAALRERVELVEARLESDEPLPADIDLVCWLDPRACGPARLRELRALRARGAALLVAGAPRAPSVLADASGASVRFEPSSPGLGTLLADLGLALAPDLLVDGTCEELTLPGGPTRTPFLVRSIAPNHDFRGFAGQPNGTLLFSAPASLVLEAERLAERGLRAQILATSSDASALHAVPPEPLPFAALEAELGRPVAKQPLVLALQPIDSFAGSAVVLAASTPFEDGFFSSERAANERLLAVLLNTLVSDERLVIARTRAPRPALLPEFSARARLGWRVWCIAALPLAWIGCAWLLRRRERAAAREPQTIGGQPHTIGAPPHTAGAQPVPAGAPRPTRARSLRPVALCAAALAAVGLLGALSRGAGLGFDWSSAGVHSLAPATRDLARASAAAGELRATFYSSAPADMPPAMRSAAAALPGALAALERAGAPLRLVRIDPADLRAEERAELAAQGIAPSAQTSRDEEVTRVRSVTCALALEQAGRREVLDFPEPESFEALEFRLAFALWRLAGNAEPTIAFASDVPRPSAAEAHEHYQVQNLFAPQGADVYGLARGALEQCDFRVEHVNPREPRMPQGASCLVWLQPRRSVLPMLEALVQHLHGGGRALVAAQHYSMQARQYPGANYKIVYWPQPQSPDVERSYFPEIGIELVRQPLFDALKTRMALDTQLHRGNARSFSAMESALPFLIRASAADYAQDSLVTRNLGDQAFVCGNWWRVDHALLAERGLRARVLMSSSPHSWQYAWSGGWIPDEVLAGPPRDEQGREQWLGRVPLALEVEGVFPYPAERLLVPPPAAGADGQPLAQEPPPPYPSAQEDPGAPGKLVLLGSSELFKNERLRVPEFRADHLLLNAVAALALPPELAEVATRRSVARGFGYVEPERRLVLRAFALGALPAALVLVGLLRRVRHGAADRDAARRSAAHAARAQAGRP
jgi:hypothetical protein